MTPRALLKKTEQELRAAGIPDPETDGALLLACLTGKPPLELRLDMTTQLPEALLEEFAVLLRRRLNREPLQYILGEAWFCGRAFFVDSRVLIPRPETELLAELGRDALKRFPGGSALDLCCGSGCIGLTLALDCPDAALFLADFSPDALAVTEKNRERLGARCELLQGDLFAAVGDRRFHIIVSNPPYIPAEDCRELQQEVLREPLLALDGGKDGLDFYRRIAREAPEHLFPGGRLLLEVGDGEADRVAALLEPEFTGITIHEDLQHLPRMVTGTLKEKSGRSTSCANFSA